MSKTKKIAVCVSGQLRGLHKTVIVDAFNNQNEHVDFYIHTWDHELNPNLEHVWNYFPIKQTRLVVDTYDEFDEVCKDFDNLDYPPENFKDAQRYLFVQYYTISKSLHMCLQSGIEYDAIWRIRTDIELFPSNSKPWDGGMEYDISAGESHMRHSKKHFGPAKDNGHVTLHHQYTSPTGDVCIRDYVWMGNHTAIKTLCTKTPSEMVQLAHSIIHDWAEKHGHTYKESAGWLTGPAMWPKIFQHFGILMNQGVSSGNGRIVRNPEVDKTKFYGAVQ